MDRDGLKRWLKPIGLGFAVLLLISAVTFDLQDPTVTNLRYPMNGVANLTGLPGALLGGSLVEFLGASALWAPLLLLNRLFVSTRRGGLPAYLIHGAALMLISATLHGLVVTETTPGLSAPGLAGLAGGRWVLHTTGAAAGALVLVAALGYALFQVLHVPLLNAALRDGRTFARFFGARGAAWLRRWKIALGGAWRARGVRAGKGGGRLAALLRGPLALLAPRRGSGSLADSGAGSGARSGEAARRTDGALLGGASAGDGFDAWFAAIREGPVDSESSEAP